MATLTAGTKLQYNEDDAGNWTNIPGVFDLTGLARQRDIIETSDLDDTVAQHIPGLKKYKPVQCQMNWDDVDDTVHSDLIDLFEAATLKGFRVVLPHSNTPYVEFSGYITDIDPNHKVNDRAVCQMTIQPTGSITTGTGG